MKITIKEATYTVGKSVDYLTVLVIPASPISLLAVMEATNLNKTVRVVEVGEDRSAVKYRAFLSDVMIEQEDVQDFEADCSGAHDNEEDKLTWCKSFLKEIEEDEL